MILLCYQIILVIYTVQFGKISEKQFKQVKTMQSNVYQ